MNQDQEERTIPFQQNPFRELWHNLILVIKGPGDADFAEHRDKNSIWSVLGPLVAVFASIVGMLASFTSDRLVLASTPEVLVRLPAMVFGVLYTIYLGVIYYKYVTPIHHLAVSTVARRLGGWTVFLPLLSLMGFGNIRDYHLIAPAFIVIILVLTFFLAFLFSHTLRSDVKDATVPGGSPDRLKTVEDVLNSWVVINFFTFIALACVLVPFPYEWTVATVKEGAGNSFWYNTFAMEPLRIEWIIFLLVLMSRAGGAIKSFTVKFSTRYWEELKDFNSCLSRKDG